MRWRDAGSLSLWSTTTTSAAEERRWGWRPGEVGRGGGGLSEFMEVCSQMVSYHHFLETKFGS